MYLEHQRGAKNRKILPFMDQCAAHPRDTTALKNIKVIVAPQTVLHKFDFNNEYDQGSKKYKSSVFLCFPWFYTFLILQFFSKVYMMM